MDSAGKKNLRKILGLFAIGMTYGAVYNPTYIRYLFYDAMMEALQCTNTQLALLNSIASIAGIAIGMPGGWLADRWGTRKCIVLSVFMNLPVCILSVMFTTTYWVQVLVWIALCFTGGFTFWPASLKAVRLSAPEGKSESAFGIFEGFCGFSSLIGNFLAIWIFSLFSDPVAGYKGAMVSMGVFSAVCAIFCWFAYKEDDEKLTEDEKQAKEQTRRNVGRDTWEVIKNPGTWLVGLVIVGAYGIYLAQSYFTAYFTGVLGAAVVFSAAMSNLRSYGMKIVGGPVGGAISTKMKSASLFDAISLICCGGLIIYVWNLEPGTPHVVGIATAFTLILAFFCCMGKGTMWATMEQAHIPREITGTAIAVISYIGFTATEAGVPYMCGHWLDMYPNDPVHAYNNIFTMLLAMAIIGAVAGFLLVLLDRHWKKKHAGGTAEDMPSGEHAEETAGQGALQ